jgi:hypothetical protein
MMSERAQASARMAGRRTKRRGPRVFAIVVAVLAIVLVVLAVVADGVARSYAEGVAANKIESSLPAGSTGTVRVTINGFSVILQALAGRLDDVTLSSHDLVVNGTPLTVTADAKRVPLSASGTTGPVDATFTIDQAALTTIPAVTSIGGKVSLEKGAISFERAVAFLGQNVTATVTAVPKPSADGSKLLVSPTGATVAGVALPKALGSALQAAAPTICVAHYLPKGATLTGVKVSTGLLTLDVHSPGLPLSKAGLTTTGSC